MKLLPHTLVLILLTFSLRAEDGVETFTRPRFSFQYLEAWHIAKEDVDYSPDNYFAIQSPGKTNIRVEVFHLEPDDSIDDLLFNALFVLDGTLIDVHGRSTIDSIGPLKGAGKHLTGNVLHMYPGGAKIFFYKSGDRGLMLTLIYWKEEYSDGDKCLEVLAKTFKFQ